MQSIPNRRCRRSGDVPSAPHSVGHLNGKALRGARFATSTSSEFMIKLLNERTRVRRFQLFSVLLCLTCSAVSVAQPSIPKQAIPSNLPAQTKTRVEALFSANAVERAKAAQDIGSFDRDQPSVAVFLVGMLGDGETIYWLLVDLSTAI